MAKELYNAGERQAGGLGIGTDGAAPCLRADDHPAAVAMRGGCAVFENHQTDARTKPLPDVSPTMGSERNAQPSNNNPLVVTGLDLYNQLETGGWR